MSPRSSEQFEQLRNQKIKLIEKAALKCFASVGFHSTSISMIAKEAKISTGLMYNYFKSKEELLKSVFMQGVEIALQPIANKNSPLTKEGFSDFIHHTFTELESNTDYWKTLMMVMVQPSVLSNYQEFMMESMMPVMNTFIEYFTTQGHEDPMVETRMLFSMIDGVCLHYLLDVEHYPLEAVKQKIIDQYG